MKYLILLIIVGSFASIGYGFSLPEAKVTLADKYIGAGTVGLFLVAMPLFSSNTAKERK
ncbi:hypothetical protein [Maribacter halichondriae]|uniref:hypothetical protein n=1 Tax=Maribacter halichondriae TaxID=2980554 RepID=UPI00235966B1|nr:hypothetical protein [Maribacter sp. Hal144]